MISFFSDLLRDDWIGKILAIIMVAVMAFLLWLAAWGLYVAADSWCLPDQDGVAEVTGRGHHAPWTQVILHHNGKTSWTQIIHHPERWTITLRLNGQIDAVDVSEATWAEVKTGQAVKVRYRKGRISNDLYVTEALFG